MTKLFIGMLFVFIDFNINLGNSSVELVPDFVGYILFVIGLAELAFESERFVKARPWSVAMAVYTAFLWVSDLFGIISSPLLSILLGLAAMAASIYVTYSIVMGVFDLERNYSRTMYAERLYMVWKWETICMAVAFVVAFIPVLAIISVIFIIAALILAIIFLVAFNKTRRAYEERDF